MPKRLYDLYHDFFTPLELSDLEFSVQENHKVLIDHLSKENRKIVLRIIDALEMICNYQTKASFIQGFKLGFELTTELQNYSPRSMENDAQHFEDFFMLNAKGDPKR